MGVAWSQFYPPSPTLTERNLPNQKGKVFIITGGASGIGLELATILYQAGGKIYIAGRSRVTALQKIEAIKSSVRDASSAGQLEYLPLDLSDLNTVKASVASFKSKESKLDVLWNNAGVSLPPPSAVSRNKVMNFKSAPIALGLSSSPNSFFHPFDPPLRAHLRVPCVLYGPVLRW